jgi:catechol 2,3-dioxygenase-like lactoylglutathione lyase family enzyme
MPITDRSTKEPLLRTGALNHGTLSCVDVVKSRRFYEEVLGMECIQVSPRVMVIRKGTEQTYTVIETGKVSTMPLINHNGFEVWSYEEVDEAYRTLMEIKDEWGLRKVNAPTMVHADYTFYFCDFDGNWWEITSVRPGGFRADFDEREDGWDLTGLHEFDGIFDKEAIQEVHTHNPAFRAKLLEGKSSQSGKPREREP